jgi:hypothetical protein
MSKTPRTDALVETFPTETGLLDLARQLETELAQAYERADEYYARLGGLFWAGAMDNMTGDDARELRDKFRAVIKRALAAGAERDEAYERAAQVCDERAQYSRTLNEPRLCATAIRALKRPPEPNAAPQPPVTPHRSKPGLAEKPDSPNCVSPESRAAIPAQTGSGDMAAGAAPRHLTRRGMASDGTLEKSDNDEVRGDGKCRLFDSNP